MSARPIADVSTRTTASAFEGINRAKPFMKQIRVWYKIAHTLNFVNFI